MEALGSELRRSLAPVVESEDRLNALHANGLG